MSYLQNIPLLAGTTYYIIVDGYASECGNFTLETYTAPPAPQDLTVRRMSATSPHVVLSWNASPGADIYYIYRGTTPSPEFLYDSTPDTTYTDHYVLNDPATQYFYAVTAVYWGEDLRN